jgi:hypothetical protein
MKKSKIKLNNLEKKTSKYSAYKAQNIHYNGIKQTKFIP